MANESTIAKRLNVGLVRQSAADLAYAMELTGHSQTDTANRAISLYAFVLRAISDGKELQVRDPATGDTQKITFI